jgi:hypothetical protein
MADDRENRGKRSLQTLVLALRHGHVGLQESREGLELGRQQVRNVKHAGALGEALADTLFLGVGVGHGRSELRRQIL